MLKKIDTTKILIAVAIALVCVLSIFVISDMFTDQEDYGNLTSTIDTQIKTVQKLSGASTLASAAISAIPGDTATPIAEKMADFTEYFLIILCVLYLERYCLPVIIGIGVFKILIPAAGAAVIAGLFKNKKLWTHVAVKILLFALAVALVIPASVKISETVYSSYGTKIDDVIVQTEQLNNDANEISNANSMGTLINALTDAVDTVVEKASTIVSSLVEMTAVMIVASCVVPVIVILFFVWLIKMLTGVDMVGGLYLKEE